MLTQQVVCPAIVGRQAELDSLASLLDQAASGRGQTVFVTGDAGVGKTRLCRELRIHAAGRDVRVLEGRCAGAESFTPYVPFLDALRFRVAEGGAETESHILGLITSHLAPLVPELRDGAANGASTPDDRPLPAERLFETIYKVFDRLAETGPLLLLLEDFQHADSTSRELLRFISRRVPALPILIVATCRSDAMPPRHPVRRLVASLSAERIGREIALRPLDEEGVARMVAAIIRTDPSPELVRVVIRRTEGNPFFIEELLQGLADAGHLIPHAADVEAARPPATVHEMVLARLEPLGAPAFDVLAVAAVIGRRFDFELLRQVTGRTEEELLSVIELLVEHQVLVEEHGVAGESYAFRHVLIQEVLYDGLLARRRRLLHRHVAATLEAQAPERVAQVVEALAFHHRAGGDSVCARKYAVAAGDQASQLFAWQEAASWYERALESLEGTDPDPALEADVLEKLAYVSWWHDRADAAVEYSEDALALRRTLGSQSALARALRRTALLTAYHRGDWALGVALLRESLALVEDRPDRIEETRIFNDLGRLSIADGDIMAAQPLSLRALELAQQIHEPAEESFALANLGLIAVLRGDVSGGTGRLEAARALAASGAASLDRATAIFAAGVRAFEAAHEHARARDWIAASREYCERHGVAAGRAITDVVQAAIALRSGERSDKVLALARHAADTLRASKRVELRDALRVLGDVHRVRGDYPAARDAYAGGARLGDLGSEAGIALVLLASDRPASAADRLRAIASSIHPDPYLLRIHLLAPAIEASVAAEQFAEAFEMLDTLQQDVDRSDCRACGPMLAYAAGLVAAATGDVGAAIEHLEAAAEDWASLGEPLEQARALAELSRVLISAERDAERGAALGREAIAILQAAGAAAEVERVRRVLRRVGMRVRTRSTADGVSAAEPQSTTPYGLTAREMDVMGQLVAGRTNKEIAAALGISEKTASIHVSHILAKLRCATRTQAAGIALANGIGQPHAAANA